MNNYTFIPAGQQIPIQPTKGVRIKNVLIVPTAGSHGAVTFHEEGKTPLLFYKGTIGTSIESVKPINIQLQMQLNGNTWQITTGVDVNIIIFSE